MPITDTAEGFLDRKLRERLRFIELENASAGEIFGIDRIRRDRGDKNFTKLGEEVRRQYAITLRHGEGVLTPEEFAERSEFSPTISEPDSGGISQVDRKAIGRILGRQRGGFVIDALDKIRGLGKRAEEEVKGLPALIDRVTGAPVRGALLHPTNPVSGAIHGFKNPEDVKSIDIGIIAALPDNSIPGTNIGLRDVVAFGADVLLDVTVVFGGVKLLTSGAKVIALRGTTRITAAGAVDSQQAITRLTAAIKDAKPAIIKTEELRKPVRASRAAKFEETLQSSDAGGMNAFDEASGQLSGKLPQARFETPNMTQLELHTLADEIRFTPRLDPLERRRAFDALVKITGDPRDLDDLIPGGIVPARNEVALLERVFGSDFTDAIRTQMPTSRKVWETSQEVWATPKTLASSFDFGGPFRQGIILSGTSAFWKDIPHGFRAMFSESYADEVAGLLRTGGDTVPGQALAAQRAQAGVFRAELGHPTRAPSAGEEAFISSFAERLPLGIGTVVRASERAHVTFLNKLRADWFDGTVANWRTAGVDVAQRDLDDLGAATNALTGRTNIKFFQDNAQWLNGIIWSPGMTMSKFEIPVRMASSSPLVRRKLVHTMVDFTGRGVAVLGMLHLAGAEVELDPRSSSFGKGQIGNSTFDFWGGFQPLARYTAQLLTGEIKTRDGKILDNEDSTGGHMFNFIQSKFAPSATFLSDALQGETAIGEPRKSITDFETGIMEALTPLFLQDLDESVALYGLEGLLIAPPAFMGIGVNSVESLGTARDGTAGSLFDGKSYEELNKAQRRIINADQRVLRITNEYQQDFGNPRQQAAFAFEAWEGVKAIYEEPVITALVNNMVGRELKDSILLLKSNRFAGSTALFQNILDDEIDVDGQPIEDIFGERFYSLEMPLGDDGLPDFDEFNRQRDELIQQAQVAFGDDEVPNSEGRSVEDYIRQSGDGTYRGHQYTHPAVQAEIENFDDVRRRIQEAGWWTMGDSAWAPIKRTLSGTPLEAHAGSYRELVEFMAGQIQPALQEIMPENAARAQALKLAGNAPLFSEYKENLNLLQTAWIISNAQLTEDANRYDLVSTSEVERIFLTILAH